MNKFARLIENTEVGQVLLTKEIDDDPGFAPIIRITFDANVDELAPSSMCIKFPDSDIDRLARDKAFEAIEESRVIDMVKTQIEKIQESFG
jgi:hypothetical protein